MCKKTKSQLQETQKIANEETSIKSKNFCAKDRNKINSKLQLEEYKLIS